MRFILCRRCSVMGRRAGWVPAGGRKAVHPSRGDWSLHQGGGSGTGRKY